MNLINIIMKKLRIKKTKSQMRNDGENLVMLFVPGSLISLLVFGINQIHICTMYIVRIWLTNFKEKVKSNI